jgi:hypothetical protein
MRRKLKTFASTWRKKTMTNILFRASLMKEIMYILIRWIVDTTTLPHWIRTFHSNIASAFFIEDMSGVQYVSVSDISIRHMIHSI